MKEIMLKSLLFIWFRNLTLIIILNLLFFLLWLIFLVLILLFFLFFFSFDLFSYFFFKKFVNWWFIESSLKPNSVHFQSSFSILQKFAMKINFYFFEATLFSHWLKFLLVKIVDTDSILFHIKVILKFSVSFTCKVELSEVISSVISEI